MNIHDATPTGSRIAILDQDIFELHQKQPGQVSEEDLKELFRKFNLRDALITLGRASNYIFGNEGSNNIGRTAHKEPQTGILITQFALAYLTNLLIIGGSNDYKARNLSEKPDNWLGLSNLYSNVLIQPELQPDFGKMDWEKFRSMMIRMYFEQMGNYQFDSLFIIARNIIIFNQVVSQIEPKKFENLCILFERETGLSIKDYLRIALAVWAASQKTSTFRIDVLTNAKITKMEDILTEDKVKNFLKILSADYASFRQVDIERNRDHNPIYTKFRFNPLFVYPIIKTQSVNGTIDPYVIPNITTYTRTAFGGFYWWFDRYFQEKEGSLKDFRDYFGSVFEEYVGLILKGVFGEQVVFKGPLYDNETREFFDWYVKYKDRIYLFECKANQFALQSLQSGDHQVLVDKEVGKMTYAISQVFKRLNDIPKFKELEEFKKAEVIPYVVFLDMPFISGDFFEPLIKGALKKIETDEKLEGLTKFNVDFLNIEDLECYDSGIGKIDLEEIFLKLKTDQKESFKSILAKAVDGKLRNKLLDKVYRDFWSQVGDPDFEKGEG